MGQCCGAATARWQEIWIANAQSRLQELRAGVHEHLQRVLQFVTHVAFGSSRNRGPSVTETEPSTISVARGW
jgi:hypothetical protein